MNWQKFALVILSLPWLFYEMAKETLVWLIETLRRSNHEA